MKQIELTNNRKEELKRQAAEIRDNMETSCWLMIKKQLGERWDIDFGHRLMEVGLLSDDGHRFVRGHTFELRYEYNEEDDIELRLNYGCMGVFNPLALDEPRTEFLVGLGKFADVRFLEELKEQIKDAADRLKTIYKKLRTM